MAPHGALHIKQKKSAKKRRFRQISAAGAKGWEHRATEAVLPERTSQGGNPRGGKRELSERQAERSSGPLDVRRE